MLPTLFELQTAVSDRCATYAEACREYAQNVATDDPDTCECRGNGWIPTNYDTYVPCPLHPTTTDHPEHYCHECGYGLSECKCSRQITQEEALAIMCSTAPTSSDPDDPFRDD